MLVKKNILLKNMTTMRVGGPARFFSTIQKITELQDSVLFAQKESVPLFILGGGSNIIVGDKGFDGLVVKINLRGIYFSDYTHGKTLLTVLAGERWDDVVRNAVQKKTYGLENLSLIPGTAGAAPIQNIGAYGQEVKETIAWVEVFNIKTMKVEQLGKDDCGFRYRDSIFKKKENSNLIITRVAFALKKHNALQTDYKDLRDYLHTHNMLKPTLSDIRNAIIAVRRYKLPDPNHLGTAGSFFKNPTISREKYLKLLTRFPELPGYSVYGGVKIPLAWVLDKLCGLKGFRDKNIGLYEKQPLVLVRYEGGTAKDIKMLAEEIKNSIEKKIGVAIDYEVVFVGDFYNF